MKGLTVRLLSALALLISAGALLGQESPKPSNEMKVLNDLVGSWDVEEDVKLPQPAKGKGVATFTKGPGDMSVMLEYKSESSPFRGQGILAWDPNERVYRSAWVDTMTPGVMVQTGKKDGTKYVYTGETWMGRQKAETRDEMEITADKIVSNAYVNGQHAMTLVYTRRK